MAVVDAFGSQNSLDVILALLQTETAKSEELSEVISYFTLVNVVNRLLPIVIILAAGALFSILGRMLVCKPVCE